LRLANSPFFLHKTFSECCHDFGRFGPAVRVYMRVWVERTWHVQESLVTWHIYKRGTKVAGAVEGAVRDTLHIKPPIAPYTLHIKPPIGHQGRQCRRRSRWRARFKNNHFTEMWCGTEAGSYLRLIDSCVTQLKAQGPSRTCNESKEKQEAPRSPLPSTEPFATLCI